MNASKISALIDRLEHEIDATSVIVTHDVESAFHLADRIALLMNGRVHAYDTPERLRASRDRLVRGFFQPRIAETV